MIKSRRMRWVGNKTCVGKTNNAFTENPKGKRLLEESRRIWEDDIKMDLKQVWCGDADRNHVSGQGLMLA
jgi:hypothetical protein